MASKHDRRVEKQANPAFAGETHTHARSYALAVQKSLGAKFARVLNGGRASQAAGGWVGAWAGMRAGMFAGERAWALRFAGPLLSVMKSDAHVGRLQWYY